ncbi:MAG: SIMPL domain-containing protein [Sphingobium sp.]|nr:SIMPL domain-containing protein [Sphingobium sp.]
MPRSPLLIAALLLTTPATVLAQTTTAPLELTGPVVTLSVTESVDAAPDKATVNTGVETRALTAKAAMAQNATQIDALIAALLKSGIERKDIQTSGINLNPQYDYANRKDGEGPRFIGYQANNNLTVTIRKLDKAGDIIDAMVGAGATNINGPAFGITDTSKLEEQARTKAVKTAQTRANFYALAAGYRGAKLLSISETGEFSPPPIAYEARLSVAAPAAAKTSVEPGQLSTSVTLNFRYMLEK